MEELMAFHCSPALAGIKPSNIINCLKKDYPNIKEYIFLLNSHLNKNGIYIKILCECDKRILLIIYREKKLFEYIKKEEISQLLQKIGYPISDGLDENLAFLQKRLKEKDFPHEIGAFLGYPPCDIYGFLCKSKCLYTGYWRVYANVEETKEKFRRFDICRKKVMEKIINGQDLSTIFGGIK